MRAKTHAACTAPSRTFILITAASDEKAMDHGDRSTSAEVASRRAPADARRRSIIAEHVDAEPKPGPIGASLRARVGRYAAAVGELGQADATSPAALPLASDGPGGLRDRNQLRAPRTVARLPPTGADLGPDSVSALVVSAAAGPLATAQREPDDVVGARKGHGPVRLTGRRGERRLARVAPAGEGGLGDDRPRRPVSRTRQ